MGEELLGVLGWLNKGCDLENFLVPFGTSYCMQLSLWLLFSSFIACLVLGDVERMGGKGTGIRVREWRIKG